MRQRWKTAKGVDVIQLSGEYSDPRVLQAIRIIKDTYGDDVSVHDKKKNLTKFGRNVSLGSSLETVWLTGESVANETYVTTNAIDTISSSSTSDEQDVIVEGHTVSGTGTDAVFTFVRQAATLDGRSKAVLSTPLARMSRIFNNSATDFVGTIYGYENGNITNGVPDTAADIHLTAGLVDGVVNNQSFKAATTVSGVDYWIILQVFGGINEKTAASADFVFEGRAPGGVFLPEFSVTASSSGSNSALNLDVPIIVAKNSDFRIRASASASSVSVDAWASGVLAKVVV